MAARAGSMALGDARADMVLMWMAASRGWSPPGEMSRERYDELRTAEPSPERAFAGSAMSFGGKWFGGYAEGNNGTRGSALAGRDKVTAAGERLAASRISWHPGVDFFDYSSPPRGTVAYLDPPYEGTTGYGDGFDHDRFWKVAESWVLDDVHVYVSEYAAPPGWRSIWAQRKPVSMSAATNQDFRLEQLFVWGDQC